MATPAEHSRKDRILDAAENAFANLGFDGASLRHIVVAAGVNLATVYYYFDSKEDLMEAVLKRRFGPLRQEQLGLLTEAREAANGRPVDLEKIFRAMLLPPLRLAATGSDNHQAVRRLIGRIVTEPNPQTQEALRCKNSDVRMAFLEALQRTLPRIPVGDLLWRLELVWGALAFALCNPRGIDQESDGCPFDPEKVVSEMISLFSPGFQADPPAKEEPAVPRFLSGTRKSKAKSANQQAGAWSQGLKRPPLAARNPD